MVLSLEGSNSSGKPERISRLAIIESSRLKDSEEPSNQHVGQTRSVIRYVVLVPEHVLQRKGKEARVGR